MKDFFADLESDLDFTGEVAAPTTKRTGDFLRDSAALHTEPCTKCGGSGNFIGYSGRIVGQCFTCKGAGTRSFKTSANTRSKARGAAVAKKASDGVANFEAFAVLEPVVANWMTSNTGFEFAQSLMAGVQKYGSLTEKQLAAAKKCADRDATRAAAKAAKVDAGPVAFDVTALKLAFDAAVLSGIKAPRLRLDAFVITRAKDHSANPGCLYVKHDGTYVGKIAADSTFSKGWDCTDEILADLMAISGNLLDRAKAHGQRTGNCCMCGRELTNALSIELGIGPICRGKWGL